MPSTALLAEVESPVDLCPRGRSSVLRRVRLPPAPRFKVPDCSSPAGLIGDLTPEPTLSPDKSLKEGFPSLHRLFRSICSFLTAHVLLQSSFIFLSCVQSHFTPTLVQRAVARGIVIVGAQGQATFGQQTRRRGADSAGHGRTTRERALALGVFSLGRSRFCALTHRSTTTTIE